ncbi:MAG: exopolysaccharide biosynthesis protein [Alphaproteobacteria bacterium]|nr:exopolysaccharide biosynthesis protein [Alphaproteobacteria bacterium]
MSAPEDAYRDDPTAGFIAVTRRLADDAGPDGLTVGELLDRLDERAFGLAILIMSIPCLVPGLYGPPQILGLPIILFAGQMLLGRSEPWLPAGMLARRVPKSWLTGMATFAEKRMRWLERIARPRLTAFASGAGERLAALMMIVATLCIVIPFTNTVPSVALALLSAGVLQRDGLFVLGGSLVALAWAALVLAIPLGILFGVGAIVTFAEQHMPWAVDLFSRTQ